MSLSFLLPTLAGLSTMIGYIFIFKKESNIVLIKSLSFASGVMFCVSIFDLLPESFKQLQNIYKIFPAILLLLIGLNIGVIISIIFDKKIKIENETSLYKVGIITMLAIIIHNIPEGIITYMATSINIKMGIHLTIAIALHNIPEGISIAIPIYYATKDKKKTLLYTIIAALSEPLGAIMAMLFLKQFITINIIGILYSIISGIMIYISICEILKESLSYNKTKYTIIYFIMGIIVMYLSINLF